MSTDPKSTYYDRDGIELVDVLRAFCTPEEFAGWLKCEAALHLLRSKWKGDERRDLEKAAQLSAWLRDEHLEPPGERQEQVRERHEYQPPVTFDDYCQMAIDAEVRRVDEERQKAQRPPDRPLASHCPDGGACRHKCGLEPCKGQS